MSLSSIGLEDFRKYFRGNENAYGVHIYGNVPKKGTKEKGNTFIKKGEVTNELYESHLEGKEGFGIIPISESNECVFGVIDVDTYTDKTEKIVDAIYEKTLPLIPFRSKSGGLHLYAFFRVPLKAETVQKFLLSHVNLLSLGTKTEIFPKQSKLYKGQTGSFINLPYYNAENTKQYIISETKEPLSFDEAMVYIGEHLISEEDMTDIQEDFPLYDAPPCLQAIYMSGETEFRNEYLFSLARYFKTKHGDDFEYKLVDANNELKEPMDTDRLFKTVISSHKKRDYTYKCKIEPLLSLCNKTECLRRKYGIGGEQVSELDYGQLTQHQTDPPYYEWVINNVSLLFYDEQDLTNQQRFRNLCLRALHTYPARLKDSVFTGILNNGLVNLKINPMSSEDDLSSGAFLKHYLYMYVEKRAQAQNKGQIKLGKVYKDEAKKAYVFMAIEFFKFLMIKGFRNFKETEVYQRLREMGGESRTYNLGKEEGRLRAWILPYESVENYSIVLDDEELEMDFGEKHENEPF